MRHILKIFALLLFALPAWAAGSLAALSSGEATGGLKEALTQGATQAVAALGRQDGFLSNPKVKIPLPDALAKAEPLLRMSGRGKDLDELVTAMNRAAEAAVPEARTLLVDAVKAMSVDDAKRILSGGDDAATQYFRSKTEDRLTELFLPVVKKNTDKLSLSTMYNQFAGQGASLGLVKAEDAKVEGYVTRKALDGLFLMIAEEEKQIRRDPVSAAGSLAKKVFGSLGR